MVYNSTDSNKKKDPVFIKDFKSRASRLDSNKKAMKLTFLKENPDAYYNLIVLEELAGRNLEVAEIEPLYKKLPARVQNTAEGKKFAAHIQSARTVLVGAIAPDFTQNDVNDKPVKLTDFRGKYVLIDFWASWCTWCREQSPNLVKQYGIYKNKKFTVLGVSLDLAGKRNEWLAAIKADGLEWTQVWEMKGGNNPVADLYRVHSLPQNVLIDPSGKIIAKNLIGEELNKKLKEVLGF